LLVTMDDIKSVHGINEKVSIDALVKGKEVFQETLKQLSGL